MTRAPRPPRLARLLASIAIRGDAREVILGDLDQEFHEAIAAHASGAAARRLYWRQTLASIAAVRRDARDRRRADGPAFLRRPLYGLTLDLKSVLRVLRRSPGYAAVAILSLAIGIGANTAIFSVVRQLVLMPLPVERPEELRFVYWSPRVNGPLGIGNINVTSYPDPSGVFYRSNVTYPQFTALRGAVSHAADLAGYNLLGRLTVSADGRPPVVTSGMLASGSFFNVVRPPLALGRGLTETDDAPGAAPVAVISHGLWARLFTNAPDALGRIVRVNGTAYEIVGVTAASYRGLSQGGFLPPTDVTVAMANQPLVSPEWTERGRTLFAAPTTYWVRLIARMTDRSDAATRNLLEVKLRPMLADGGIKQEIAANAAVALPSGARGLDGLRTSTHLPLRILAVVSGVVLFIACLNVAGLMLARGVSRQRELAVRRALGASRGRIMRELLLESAILSVTGGVTGLVLAVWIAPVLQSMLASGLGTSGVSVSLDWPLLGATAALACTAGLIAGLLPAIRLSRNMEAMLKDRTGAAGVPKLKIGRALLALQIAVSLPLVAGAGLFLRTLYNLARVDLGFDPRGLVLFTTDPTMNGRTPERMATVFPRLLERIETIPGVASATVLENALVSGSESDTTVTVDGREVLLYLNAVGPHYFETMGVRLVAGRPLLASDSAEAPRVVVINETAARMYFAGRSPIGGRIKNGKRELEVVGVAADSKYDGLRLAVQPTMLQSYLQRQLGSMTVAVRGSGSASELRAAINAAAHDVDPALPIASYKTQLEQIDETIGKERVFTRLLTAFGGFALLLACVGLHGVTSYSVARLTPEIGIRLALGAQRSQVRWLVLRQVIVLAAAGLAIGLPIAWFAGPVATNYLFDLDARDPMTIGAAAAVMVFVALGAGFWPARRAARLDALTALRSE
jgi:predicted permease